MKVSYYFILFLSLSPLCINGSDVYKDKKREIVGRVDSSELRKGLKELQNTFKQIVQREQLTLINSMITILEELKRREGLPAETNLLNALNVFKSVLTNRRGR